MAKERWELANEQWKKIEKFCPKLKSSQKGAEHGRIKYSGGWQSEFGY